VTEPLLTAAEVAELLGLSPATVLDRFQAGDLPGFRLFGRKGGGHGGRHSHRGRHGTSSRRSGQTLGYAVAVGLLDTNPAKQIPNPEPKRSEVLPFGSLAEVEAVADELLPHYRTIPIIGCLTGLRPSELFGLERRDVDRAGKLLHVRRVLVGGNLRPYGKTAGAMRSSRSPSGRWTPSMPIPRGSTRRRCSRPAQALPWTCTAGGDATVRPPFAPPDSTTAGRTR
jgi:integrase